MKAPMEIGAFFMAENESFYLQILKITIFA